MLRNWLRAAALLTAAALGLSSKPLAAQVPISYDLRGPNVGLGVYAAQSGVAGLRLGFDYPFAYSPRERRRGTLDRHWTASVDFLTFRSYFGEHPSMLLFGLSRRRVAPSGFTTTYGLLIGPSQTAIRDIGRSSASPRVTTVAVTGIAFGPNLTFGYDFSRNARVPLSVWFAPRLTLEFFNHSSLYFGGYAHAALEGGIGFEVNNRRPRAPQKGRRARPAVAAL